MIGWFNGRYNWNEEEEISHGLIWGTSPALHGGNEEALGYNDLFPSLVSIRPPPV